MTVVLTINDSGTPKANIIEMAFEECGSAGYEFERTPEEVASALRKLDALMGEWPWNTLGYTMADYGAGLPIDLSGIGSEYVQAVALELAFRIGGGMGAEFTMDQRASRISSRSLVASAAAAATVPTALIARNTPRGAGARGTPFIYDTEA